MNLRYYMRLFLKIILPIIVLGFAAVYLVNSLKPTAIVMRVERGKAVRAVPGTVEVLAKQEMEIRGEGHGRVVESWIEIGSKVEEGQQIIQLDTGDLDLELERTRNELKALVDNFALGSPHRFSQEAARSRLEEQVKMFERGATSEKVVDEHRREIARLQDVIDRDAAHYDLRVNQLNLQIKNLGRQLGLRKVVSPVSGTITEVHAYKGDLLGHGQTVARIISSERVVEVRIGEENFAGLEVGQRARVKFLGYGADVFDGVVSKVLPVADAATQRYTIHLDLEIDFEKLFPGLTGEARITLDERDDTLIMPRMALEGATVYVVEDKTVRLRTVAAGYRNLSSVEVLDGLDEGDLVIVDNLELFKEGDQVQVEMAE